MESLEAFFTPTEASIIAVVYAIPCGPVCVQETEFFQHSVHRTGLYEDLCIADGIGRLCEPLWLDSDHGAAPPMDFRRDPFIHQNKYLVLLLINLLLIFVGTFMETIAALLILFPILLKVALTVGVDPIHFGVIAVLNLIIGLTTPPVGGVSVCGFPVLVRSLSGRSARPAGPFCWSV